MIRHCQRQLCSSFVHHYAFYELHLALFTITPFTNFINHSSHTSTECFLTLRMLEVRNAFLLSSSVPLYSMIVFLCRRLILRLRTGFRFPSFLSTGFIRKTFFIYWYNRPEFFRILPDMIRASHRRDCPRAMVALANLSIVHYSSIFPSDPQLHSLNHQFLK